MSKRRFNGPLLFIILGGLVLLAYRYLPYEPLLEMPNTGRGDTRPAGQGAPPMVQQQPAESLPLPVPATPPALEARDFLPADSALPPVASVTSSATREEAEQSSAISPEASVPTVSPRPSPVAATEIQPPPPAPESPLPNLRVYVQADVNDRAGLGDISADRYAELLRAELALVAGDYLGREAVQGDGANTAFRQYIAEGRQGLEQFCGQARARRVLLADVSISAAGFSGVDSAYWPEVTFVAINCSDGRVHKSSKKRLEPNRMDRFGFQQQFNRRSQEFIASQGYFLKP